jgi:hypothetical protein
VSYYLPKRGKETVMGEATTRKLEASAKVLEGLTAEKADLILSLLEACATVPKDDPLWGKLKEKIGESKPRPPETTAFRAYSDVVRLFNEKLDSQINKLRFVAAAALGGTEFDVWVNSERGAVADGLSTLLMEVFDAYDEVYREIDAKVDAAKAAEATK